MKPAGIGRRRWLCCAGACGLAAAAGPASALVGDDWAAPSRFTRPEVGTDEGGLWALMDREETRLRRSAFILRDSGLRDYLSGIACKLGGEHCADTRVYAVRSPWFNASMAPNGMMQVWSGLLLRVDNEAQLASVIGHEIGHYLQRHSIERLRDMRSRSAFMSLMAVAGVVGLLGQLAALAGAYGYSRDNELDADRIGVALMRRVGYDTREAATVWRNLRAELSAGAGGDPAKQSVLFATHPASDERQRILETLSAADSGFLGDVEYARRIEPFMPDLIEDELRRTQYDETIVLMARLAERRPQRADLHYGRGEAHRLRNQAGDVEAAERELRLATTLEGPPALAQRSLGLLYRQLGRKPEAREAFDAYLEQAPAAPDAAMIQSYLSELT